MSDNLNWRGPPDTTFVALLESWEVKYVAEKFSVTPEIVSAA